VRSPIIPPSEKVPDSISRERRRTAHFVFIFYSNSMSNPSNSVKQSSRAFSFSESHSIAIGERFRIIHGVLLFPISLLQQEKEMVARYHSRGLFMPGHGHRISQKLKTVGWSAGVIVRIGMTALFNFRPRARQRLCIWFSVESYQVNSSFKHGN
jgi:hypothetical protein